MSAEVEKMMALEAGNQTFCKVFDVGPSVEFSYSIYQGIFIVEQKMTTSDYLFQKELIEGEPSFCQTINKFIRRRTGGSTIIGINDVWDGMGEVMKRTGLKIHVEKNNPVIVLKDPKSREEYIKTGGVLVRASTAVEFCVPIVNGLPNLTSGFDNIAINRKHLVHNYSPEVVVCDFESPLVETGSLVSTNIQKGFEEIKPRSLFDCVAIVKL